MAFVGRRLFHNFLTLFAGNVVGQLLFFAGALYLARVLGPAGYGVWSFAQAWQLYLLRIGEFGLEVTGIREIARRPEDTSTWSATVVITRISIAVILFVATMFICSNDLIPLDTGGVVLLFSLSVFPMALLLEWVYEAKQNVFVTSLARVAKGILFGVGVLFLVEDSSDISLSVIIYVLSIAIPSVIIFFLAVRSFGLDIGSFRFRRGVDAVRKASSVGVATILSHYSLFVGTMTIGYLLSKTELGLFSAAHRVVVLPWAYVIVSFQRVLLPVLSMWFHESRHQYRAFVENFFRLAVICSIAVGVVGTIFGPFLMSVLYTSAYAGSMGVFTILLWALVFAGIRFVLEIGLIASDNQRRYLGGMAFLSIVYTIATPILSLEYGIEGAAWASVIAESLYFLYLAFTFKHLDAVALLKHLWKPALGGLAAVGIGLSIQTQGLYTQAAISIGVYLGIIASTKALSTTDLRMIFNLVGHNTLED